MADRLINTRQLEGKTRTEIFLLLGEPPPKEYFRDWDLVYRLGMERSFISIDSEWLVIRTDETGKAVEISLAKD